MGSREFLLWVISIEHLYFFFLFIFYLGILISNKKPSSSISWILIVTLLPVVGMFVYILFGINWRGRKALKLYNKNSKSRILDLLTENLVKYDSGEIFKSEDIKYIDEVLKEVDLSDEAKNIIKLLHNSEGTCLTKNDSCDFYFNGKKAFDSMAEDIKKAKKSIYMEYYIWASDNLGEEVKELLIKKVQEGVEVKLIFDGWGSLGKISKKYKKELRKNGIEFNYFLSMKLNFLKANYRNHRKMVLIDNKILHTGGLNLADEYLDGGKKYKSWRDTNVRITGGIVLNYLALFIVDWLNSGGHIDYEALKKSTQKCEVNFNTDKNGKKSYLMQMSSSDPDTIFESLKMLYGKLIASAKKEILIESPYFIPDEYLLNVLKVASLSGVDVKIILTGVPDKKIPYWAAETYFDELILSGIKIYRYMEGFLHCKNIIVDNEMSSLGTCNFDIRSFELNYEVNSIYYDSGISDILRKQFHKDLEYCDEVTEEYLLKKSFFKRIRNSIFRIMSPLL